MGEVVLWPISSLPVPLDWSTLLARSTGCNFKGERANGCASQGFEWNKGIDLPGGSSVAQSALLGPWHHLHHLLRCNCRHTVGHDEHLVLNRKDRMASEFIRKWRRCKLTVLWQIDKGQDGKWICMMDEHEQCSTIVGEGENGILIVLSGKTVWHETSFTSWGHLFYWLSVFTVNFPVSQLTWRVRWCPLLNEEEKVANVNINPVKRLEDNWRLCTLGQSFCVRLHHLASSVTFSCLRLRD